MVVSKRFPFLIGRIRTVEKLEEASEIARGFPFLIGRIRTLPEWMSDFEALKVSIPHR